MQHVRSEAVALCLAGGLVEAEVHPSGAGAYRVLLVARTILLPEVRSPLLAAVTTRNTSVEIQIEELASRARSP